MEVTTAESVRTSGSVKSIVRTFVPDSSGGEGGFRNRNFFAHADC